MIKTFQILLHERTTAYLDKKYPIALIVYKRAETK